MLVEAEQKWIEEDRIMEANKIGKITRVFGHSNTSFQSQILNTLMSNDVHVSFIILNFRST